MTEFRERALSIPGVEQIGQARVTPFSGYSRSPIYIEGKTDNLTPASLWFNRETVGPNYFKTLKIPIIKGRSFTEQDSPSGLRVAIIDESLARSFWPNEDPVGQRFKIGRADTDRPWLTIVGVVGAIRQDLFSNESFGKFYLPYSQNPDRSMVLLIRTASDPSGYAVSLRSVFEETFGESASLDIRTLDGVLAYSFIFPGFIMKLMGIFAGSALVMVVVGIYGLVAYSVAQRTHEIGIRMALGAQTLDIFHLVLSQGLIMTLIGVGIGLVAAFGLTRFLGGLLIDITPTDPLTFAGIALLLVIAAVLASYIPARKATKVDPMVVLRYE
jgi:predicted permease